MGVQSTQAGILPTPTQHPSRHPPPHARSLADPVPVAGCFLPPLTSQATHPSPRALASAPPAGQECWRQARTLGRPVLTGEMVVHLVTFGFFPGVLASFSPHAQGPIAGLGRELSQRRLWGKIEESEVMSDRAAGSAP